MVPQELKFKISFTSKIGIFYNFNCLIRQVGIIIWYFIGASVSFIKIRVKLADKGGIFFII